jgi:hypothetical protein
MILFQTQVLHLQNKAYDLCINLIIGMFLVLVMFVLLLCILGPRILLVGASAKRSRSTACFRAGGGGVLWAMRSRSTKCSGARGGGVLRAKRPRSTACSGRSGRGQGQSDRVASRGALRRRRRALGIGGVEDLNRASDKNLLSVERAARAPDIYIGARCMTHVH